MSKLVAVPDPSPHVSSARGPLQITLQFQLHVPPAEAFDLMATRLGEWFQQIHAVDWNHARSERGATTVGRCSERVCDFAGKSLVEEITEFEAGSHYAYRIDFARSQMKMPITNHLGTFDVEPAPSGRGSIVTWRQYFRAKWFVPAAMLRWQMRDKLMRPAVDEAIKKYGGGWITEKN